MPETLPQKETSRRDWSLAGLVGLLSGLVSGATLNPLGEASSSIWWWPDELTGFLSVFALSAGLAFGVAGAAFLMLRKGVSLLLGGVWLLTSILGIAVAVYVAVMAFDYDSAPQTYVLSYLAGSPVGALTMAIPIVLLARLADPVKVIATATIGPTIWSVGVALIMQIVGADSAISIPWAAALFIGWQAIFLMVITAAHAKET